MLKFPFYLLCFLWLLSCGVPQKTPDTPFGRDSTIDFSILMKMVGKVVADSFIKDSFKLNEICIATLMGNDGMSYVFIRKHQWQFLDSLEDKMDFREEDINGDGLPDAVGKGFADVHGMSSNYIYLQRADTFFKVETPEGLCNARYDSVGRVVRSYYISGPFGVHNKEEYRWNHDSLILLRGVEMFVSKDKPVVRWYHNMGNAIVTDKEVEDEAVYDTAFWKGYY